MKRTKIYFIIVLLSFFFWSTQTYAVGVPSTFSYQGRLTDSSGNLLGSSSGTTYHFKFSLWNVSTGGTTGVNRLWPSSDPSSAPIVVRQGVFNTDINTSGYNFNNSSDVYLQIEVSSDNVNFETLDPRQRISATPFAQVSGAVSGTGQSSFGTTTPINNALVSIEATSTQSIGLIIRGFSGQLANLFQIQNSTGSNLFTVDNVGNVGIGASPNRKLDVSDANSVPQLRLGQSASVYGEFYADSAGDVRVSSTGGNIRNNDENLWVCSGGSCDSSISPAGKGNIVVENAVIFDNKFKLKQIDASTTVMYDTTDNPIFEFDEGQ
jgi:hypothetical protein